MELRNQRRTRDQWQTLVEQFAASSLSQELFCEQHGVSEKTFHNWRLRLNRETQPSSFLPITTQGIAQTGHHGDTITVRSGDVMIEVPVTVGMAAIGDLVRALHSVE